MDRPTHEQIKEFCNNSHHRPMSFSEIDSIESFTAICKYKKDAVALAQGINNRFGVWVYAMVYDEWKNPHVSIGYRQEELPKCQYCSWIGGQHSDYCKRPR